MAGRRRFIGEFSRTDVAVPSNRRRPFNFGRLSRNNQFKSFQLFCLDYNYFLFFGNSIRRMTWWVDNRMATTPSADRTWTSPIGFRSKSISRSSIVSALFPNILNFPQFWLDERRYSILPVNDPKEIAKMGFYETAFSKLTTKVCPFLQKFINSFISNSNGIAMNWKQQCDAFVAPFIVDPSRAARMDFTSGLAWTEPYNIVVPKPELRSRLFAFIRPFQPSVFRQMFTILISYQFQMNWIGWIRFGWAFCWRLSSWSSSWRSSRGFTKNIRKLKINQTERYHQLELSSATTPSTSSTC